MNQNKHSRYFYFRAIICFLLIGFQAQSLVAQTQISILEEQVNDLHGKEKLLMLHEITEYYIEAKNDKKALKYARQAEFLANNIIREENGEITSEDFQLKPITQINLGKAYQLKGRYLESKKAFNEALISSEELEIFDFSTIANDYIIEIDSISRYTPSEKRPFLGKTFRDIGKAIDKTTNEFGATASLKIAKVYADQEDYDKAMNQLVIVKNLLQDMGKFEKLNEVNEFIKEIQTEIEKQEVDAENESSPSSSINSVQPKVQVLQPTISTPQLNSGYNAQAPSVLPTPSSPVTPKVSNPEQIRRAAQNAETNRNYAQSIDYYKQYIKSQQELQESLTTQQLALLEKANEIENRDREILILKQNDQILEAEIKQKKIANRNLAVGTGLLGLILFSLYFMYFNKQRAHKKLSTAYTKLETTQNKLQTAQLRIKSLLHQQVSGAVANELLSSTGDHPIARKFVCIMFLDIRDFTVFAEERNPEEIIEYQNNVFGFMIETINKHHGIVNQILGDGFMATFGAPISATNDCQDAFLAAREIIDTVKAKSLAGEIPPTKVGIGLHAGYVVTGNVGTADRKQYSITGNPVIIASRLEQLNKTYGSSIVISKDVYDKLPEEERTPMDFNEVTVKGRSKPVEVAVI